MRYTEIYKEARRLHDLGLAVHWLHPRSKRPVGMGWTTGPRKSWQELEKEFKPEMNVGVRTGNASKIGERYLTVIDVDIKSAEPHHRLEANAAVKALLGGLRPPMVRSGRGGGSRHYYVVTEKPFASFNPAASTEFVKLKLNKPVTRRDREILSEPDIEGGYRMVRAWEISVMNEGRQVVVPPSRHPDTGAIYEWARPIAASSELPVFLVPSDNLGNTLNDIKAPLAENAVQTESLRISEVKPQTVKPLLKDFKFEAVDVDLGWLPGISDVVVHKIKTCEGVGDRSAYMLVAASALISAGLNDNEVLSVLTDPTTALGQASLSHAGETRDRRRAAFWVSQFTYGKVKAERSPELVFEGLQLPPVPDKSGEAKPSDTDWKSDLTRGQKGLVIPSFRNLEAILSHCVQGPLFMRDVFANRIKYGVDSPWKRKAETALEDDDMIFVKSWLTKTYYKGGLEPSTNLIREVTSLLAHEKSIHPVKDWFETLHWDGIPRINFWLKTYCLAQAPEPYLSEVSRKFLLAMVKRIYQPGCQWDYTLVLEGPQGLRKSTIARTIASDPWFMDNLPHLTDKDAMLNLQGKWVIELGELAGVKRADYNLVKAYLTRRVDTVRDHYGRIARDTPRQSVFIGTINEGQYFTDPTGNRRYWPVKVGACDVDGLKLVRDQLFAEALHIYRATDEILMLGPQATEQAHDSQEDRRVEDEHSEMRDALLEFYGTESGQKFNWKRFKLKELKVGRDVPWGAWGQRGYHGQVMADVLRKEGFIKDRSENDRYWYTPKELVEKIKNWRS